MNRRWFSEYNTSPTDIKSMEAGSASGYKVVAVVGAAHDWAAYRGPMEWTDEEIAQSGDKISKTAAEALFYGFRNSKLRYRE